MALEVLREVRERDAYANLLLPGLLRRRPMPRHDRALATDLVYGTLRWQGLLDAVIDHAATRSRLDPRVRDILRLGAYQLVVAGFPPHAAVSTSVSLARRLGVGHASGFVNALLRTVARHDRADWVGRVAPDEASDPVGHLSVALSHPRWMVEALQESLGPTADLARLRTLLATDNTPAPVTLAARPPVSSAGELLQAGGEPGRYVPTAVRIAGDPGRIPAVRERRAAVQDEGSQLVALAATRAPLAGSGPDLTWVDLCAGPGGKTGALASIAAASSSSSSAGGGGARVLAMELLPGRARLVRRATSTMGEAVAVLRADGTRPPLQPASVDRVLVDAPCTGLGAIRRRPDARWRRRPENVAGLVERQRELLGSALDLVAVGGVVTYATCSPHRAETVGVLQHVLQRRADVETLDARMLLPEVPDLPPGPFVQLWPDQHDTDAMFLAVLRRREVAD